MLCKRRVEMRQIVVKYAMYPCKNGILQGRYRFQGSGRGKLGGSFVRGLLVKGLCSLHDNAKESKSVVFNKVRIKNLRDDCMLGSAFRGFDGCFEHCVLFQNPKDWCEQLVHALSITNVRVQFAKDKEDIQHDGLGVWLAKVKIVRHASVDILHDFCTQSLVLP
jgi:hypothetical protein